jgi:hypothetical protein
MNIATPTPSSQLKK